MDRDTKSRLWLGFLLATSGFALALDFDLGRPSSALKDLGMLMILIVLTALGSMPKKGQWKARLAALPITLRCVLWSGVLFMGLAAAWQLWERWTAFRQEDLVPILVFTAVFSVVCLIVRWVRKTRD